MKSQEQLFLDAVTRVLERVPDFQIEEVRGDLFSENRLVADYFVTARRNGEKMRFVVEMKSNGEPRHVRSAVLQLLDCARGMGGGIVPILVAPFLSERSREICAQAGVCYVDLVGNARIEFDAVFIETTTSETPRSATKVFRSIFSPKATLVLRVMLQHPEQTWRVTDLAQQAGVSLGHVSNVRKALIDQEWVTETSNGVSLTNPDSLLDTWREHYRRPVRQRVSGHSNFQGVELQEKLRSVLGQNSDGGIAVFSLRSAAQWHMNGEQCPKNYFFSNQAGLERLVEALDVSHSPRGDNIDIRCVKDQSVFRDAYEAAPGLFCTSPLQTYLDLWKGTNLDRQDARSLRQERLQFQERGNQ